MTALSKISGRYIDLPLLHKYQGYFKSPTEIYLKYTDVELSNKDGVKIKKLQWQSND
jgi:hypothetical protein